MTISCVYLLIGPSKESQACLPGRPSKAAPHVGEGMAAIRPQSTAWLSTQRITEFPARQEPLSFFLLLAHGIWRAGIEGTSGCPIQSSGSLTLIPLPPSAPTTSLLLNPLLKSGHHFSTPSPYPFPRHLHQLKQRRRLLLIKRHHPPSTQDLGEQQTAESLSPAVRLSPSQSLWTRTARHSYHSDPCSTTSLLCDSVQITPISSGLSFLV